MHEHAVNIAPAVEQFLEHLQNTTREQFLALLDAESAFDAMFESTLRGVTQGGAPAQSTLLVRFNDRQGEQYSAVITFYPAALCGAPLVLGRALRLRDGVPVAVYAGVDEGEGYVKIRFESHAAH